MAAYAEALAGFSDQSVEIAARRTLPGTINALVVTYYKSDEWRALAADTQKTRRRIIERFRAQHGDKRVALLRQEHIIKMVGEIEKPSAKRNWLKTIRGLMQAAVPTMRKDDPTAGIPGIKLPKSRGSSDWVRSTSRTGGSASSARTAAKTWTSRYRPSCKPRAMPCLKAHLTYIVTVHGK